MNGKDTVKIATIGMSTDLKAARLLNTSAIDTNENNWEEDEHEEVSWNLDDPNMPEWLRQYI